MKEFFKNLRTGLLFFLTSIIVMCFGLELHYGITAIPSCSGWEAIGLMFTCLLLGSIIVFIIYCVGVIPNATVDRLNDTVDRLNRKIADLEDTEDDPQ